MFHQSAHSRCPDSRSPCTLKVSSWTVAFIFGNARETSASTRISISTWMRVVEGLKEVSRQKEAELFLGAAHIRIYRFLLCV